jgi:hypothetical protein
MPIYQKYARHDHPAIPPIRRNIRFWERGEGRESDGGFLGVGL